MSASDPGQVSNQSSSDDSNTVFWADMNSVLKQKHDDAVQDDMYEQELSLQEAARMQSILDSENSDVNNTHGSGVLSVLNDTPPSPINLAGGASAPTSSATVKKMTNTINQV